MASSPCFRGRISSPLEAGPSVAEGHHLPGNVSEALEYTSRKLGKKAAHITLLVVRRDYQLPTSPIVSPTSSPASPPRSAASRIEALKQLIRPGNSGEGQVRERILHVHLDHYRNGTASPAFSEASTPSSVSSVSTADSTFSHRRWPGSPAAYGSVPVTPATPFTVMSSVSGVEAGSAAPPVGQCSIKLVYAHPLSPREQKALSQALDKAARKFKLDAWLPQPVSPSTIGLPVDLVWKSTTQNEMLFSSEHLTLLSLDRLYTFRTALQAYSRSHAPSRLEDAVDELRRLFLANGRRALRKSALLASYRWLDPVSDAALADVCRMYERAYGGIKRERGVEDDVDPIPAWPIPEPNREPVERMGMAFPEKPYQPPQPQSETPINEGPKRSWAAKEIILPAADLTQDEQSDDDGLEDIEAWYRHVPMDRIDPLRSHPATITTVILPPSPSPTPPPPPPPKSPIRPQPVEMRQTTPKLRPAPPGRSLALRLQTTFDKPKIKPNQPKQQEQQSLSPSQPSPKGPKEAEEEEEEEEEEDLTARPRSAVKTHSFAHLGWPSSTNGISIDSMLLDRDGEQQVEERVGPMTPHGYEDISPITRGEWGFLMGGPGGLFGRVAKVETC